MTALEEFRNEVESFLERSGMAHTTFGTKAMGDAMFVQRLRKGSDPKISTAERVRKFIKSMNGTNDPQERNNG